MNRISAEEFSEILQSESAYQSFLETLDSRSPLFLPEAKNFQISGPAVFCPHKYRPLTENLVDKFVSYLLSLKKSYLHNYHDAGLNRDCLNYMVTIFPLWVKWIQTDSYAESMDFHEAMTTIQNPSKEEIEQIQQQLAPVAPETGVEIIAEARGDYERCSRLAGEYPPFSVRV
jgi:hypothetical protein